MFPVVHVLALWAIAVAQPVYDILGRNGEFFIAHRTQPVDLLLFAATVSLVLPLILAVPYMLAARWWPRAARGIRWGKRRRPRRARRRAGRS